MPSVKTGQYIPPISLYGKPGKNIEGIDRYAAQIVEDEDLLAEVLRRAALICPDAIVEALADGYDRVESIREGKGRYFHVAATGGK